MGKYFNWIWSNAGAHWKQMEQFEKNIREIKSNRNISASKSLNKIEWSSEIRKAMPTVARYSGISLWRMVIISIQTIRGKIK